MNKKAIAILGAIFILIVGTLGFLIYSKYSGSKTAPPPVAGNNATSTATGGQENNATSTQPASLGGRAVLLTSDQVVSPVLFYNGSGITYFDNSGQLFQSNIDASAVVLQLTNKKKLSIPVKANIKKILWPQKGDNFIAQSVDGNGNKIFSFYSSQSGAYLDLPKQVYSVGWMPNGDKIYYVWSSGDPAKHDLVEVADPDTKNYQKVGEIWNKNAAVSVSPDGNSVLAYSDNNNSDVNTIVLTTPDGKVWKNIVSSGYNFGVLWSPDSKKFLFGKKNSATQQYQLWYYNLTTDEVKNLGLPTTPDKAVWDLDSQTIYVAASNSDTGAAGDMFAKLNTSTLEKKVYPTGTVVIVGTDLFLNATSDKLFFRNAQDGGLYYLDLAQ